MRRIHRVNKIENSMSRINMAEELSNSDNVNKLDGNEQKASQQRPQIQLEEAIQQSLNSIEELIKPKKELL